MPNKYKPYTYIVINGPLDDIRCVRMCPNRKRTICAVRPTEKGCCIDCEIYKDKNKKDEH